MAKKDKPLIRSILVLAVLGVLLLPTLSFLFQTDLFKKKRSGRIEIYEDASVREEAPNTNFGQATRLVLNGNYNNRAYAYLKVTWDESYGSFEQAELYFFVPEECTSPNPLEVWLTESDWGEGSWECHETELCVGTDALTWTEKPSPETKLGEFTMLADSEWYSVDLTQPLLQALANGEKSLGLVLLQKETINIQAGCCSSSEASEQLRPFVKLY